MAMSHIKSNYKDVLNFCSENHIINLDDVETAMKKAEIEKVIKKYHPYSISQGKDGRFKTYIKTDNGRKLIAKVTLEKLNIALYEHYNRIEKINEGELVTLKTLYPKWLEYKSLHTDAPTYIKRINVDWNKFYKDTEIIETPITKLDKLTLDIWAHSLIKQYSLTKKQYFNCTVIMRQSLRYAVELGIIEKSPFDDIRVDGRKLFRKVKKKDSYTQVFTHYEQQQITELAWKEFHETSITTHKFAPLSIVFQFLTGVRVGELCALRHQDVNERYTQIHIERFLRTLNNEIVEHTKGSYGDRFVIITTQAKEILKTIEEEKMKFGLPLDGYIFSINSDPLPYSTVYKLYMHYCDTIGTFRKGPHKSRKTYISTLIDAGVNINTIRATVGHCDEHTTLQAYCFDRSTEDEQVEMFEKALR